MRTLVQNAGLAATLIVPSAIVLIALEFLYVVPRPASRRVVLLRRFLIALAVILLAALGLLILARFKELRVQ